MELLSGAFWAGDPHPALEWLRDNQPVWWDEQSRGFGVASHALVKEASTKPDVFSNSGGNVPRAPKLDNMICHDDPEHVRRRRLVNRGFTPRQVRRLEEVVVSTCHRLLDAICERGGADLVADLASPLPMAVIGTLLGADPASWPSLLQWSDDMMEALGGRSTEPGAIERAQASFESFDRFARGVIAQRRAEKGEDLVAALVSGERDVGLGEDALVHELLLLLVGGDETSRHAISGGLRELLLHPDQLDLLQGDRRLIATAVEEILRWTSPVKIMQRTCLVDAELGGVPIPAKSRVLLLYPSANRDAAVFDQPHCFDVTRQPNDHLAFGFGTHYCLGASLGRMEVAIVLEAVLDRLPELRLEPGHLPTVRPAYFVTGIESLPVQFAPTPPRCGVR
jgi:cytochrome P450 family 142 subfamily A polypeptide 1